MLECPLILSVLLLTRCVFTHNNRKVSFNKTEKKTDVL